MGGQTFKVGMAVLLSVGLYILYGDNTLDEGTFLKVTFCEQ
jgi:hypothetical protein